MYTVHSTPAHLRTYACKFRLAKLKKKKKDYKYCASLSIMSIQCNSLVFHFTFWGLSLRTDYPHRWSQSHSRHLHEPEETQELMSVDRVALNHLMHLPTKTYLTEPMQNQGLTWKCCLKPEGFLNNLKLSNKIFYFSSTEEKHNVKPSTFIVYYCFSLIVINI